MYREHYTPPKRAKGWKRVLGWALVVLLGLFWAAVVAEQL